MGRALLPLADIERASREVERYLSSLDLNELVIPAVLPQWICGGSRSTFLVGIKGAHGSSSRAGSSSSLIGSDNMTRGSKSVRSQASWDAMSASNGGRSGGDTAGAVYSRLVSLSL